MTLLATSFVHFATSMLNGGETDTELRIVLYKEYPA